MRDHAQAQKHSTFPSRDRVIMLLAAGYLILPIVIFSFGWLRWYYALGVFALLTLFSRDLMRELGDRGGEVLNRRSMRFWIITLAAVLLWVYLSGIGGYAYQNSDFWARNAAFRDLCNYDWPVVYDLSKQPEAARAITGGGSAAFSYYFCWWLPVALVVKVFSLGEAAAHALLWCWAVLGVFLALYCLCRYLRSRSFLIPVVFILFSGLDIAGALIMRVPLELGSHLEWWSNYFQYSSNTTQLFWVFNQSLPVWLAAGLFLNLKSSRCSLALASLTFAFSPWATLGMLPLAAASVFEHREPLKKALTVSECAVSAAMALVFGAFYLSSSGSAGGVELVFSHFPNETKSLLLSLALFLLLEACVLLLALGRGARSYPCYYAVLAELLLFPLIYIRGNFTMRGTAPALFMLMVYILKFLIEPPAAAPKWRKKLLAALLIVGAVTPLFEMVRSAKNTLAGGDYLQEQVYSLGEIRTDDPLIISTIADQFFVYDREGEFFFRYLAK